MSTARPAVVLGTGFADELARLGARPVAGATVSLHRIDSGGLVLVRHGADHRVPPHRVDHHAHVRALLDAGATDVFAFASAGSLRSSIRVGDLMTPDDFLDTSGTPPTFFDDEVRHTSVHEPFDRALAARIRDRFNALGGGGGTVHAGGVYVQVRGPRYPTRAECALYATHGDVVGMTIASEATLAAERGLRYACACLVTDGHDEVAVDHDKIKAAAPATRERLRMLIAELLT